MRRIFAEFITEKIKQDSTIHILSIDFADYLFEKLNKESPGHYWNFGVTEQATIAIAAGMAQEGLKPYVFGITPFALERPFEFIKLDVVEQNTNVKIVGYWDYENDGVTHKTKDPEAVCNTLGIRCFSPKNASETINMFNLSYKNNSPTFFNLTRCEDYNGF